VTTANLDAETCQGAKTCHAQTDTGVSRGAKTDTGVPFQLAKTANTNEPADWTRSSFRKDFHTLARLQN
jgi:hypothetical protein